MAESQQTDHWLKTMHGILRKPLPGTDVQWEMASSDRKITNFPRKTPAGTRQAAVMILLYPVNGFISTFLIQRSVYKGVHSGQVSLPGGKRDSSDKNLIETALRECNEEAGIPPDNIIILGELTPLYIPVSNVEVTPVVGWLPEKPHFIPDKREVDKIIEVQLKEMAVPEIIKEKVMPVRGEELMVKYYDYKGVVIWGATAMIIHELLTIFHGYNDFCFIAGR